jgi:hypothetical protein
VIKVHQALARACGIKANDQLLPEYILSNGMLPTGNVIVIGSLLNEEMIPAMFVPLYSQQLAEIITPGGF